MSATTAASVALRNNNKFPFTTSQWQELEHQALIYKYMAAGIPIPPDLLFNIKRSLDSSISSKLFPYQSSPCKSKTRLFLGRLETVSAVEQVSEEKIRRAVTKKWAGAEVQDHVHGSKPIKPINHGSELS